MEGSTRDLELTGKSVVVTGAGSNIGQARALLDAAHTQHGRVDVLVNCVGWDQLMYFTDTTPEFWQRIIQVNFVGVLNCTSAALAHMVPAKSGSIVSISSDASRQGEAREAVYGGTKAAVNSFMKTIAKENGRVGIRCNVVCPGVTIPEDDDETSMWSVKDSIFTADRRAIIGERILMNSAGPFVAVSAPLLATLPQPRSGSTWSFGLAYANAMVASCGFRPKRRNVSMAGQAQPSISLVHSASPARISVTTPLATTKRSRRCCSSGSFGTKSR